MLRNYEEYSLRTSLGNKNVTVSEITEQKTTVTNNLSYSCYLYIVCYLSIVAKRSLFYR